MNGDCGAMDEPTNELDEQCDPTKLSDLKSPECITNGKSEQNSCKPLNQDVEEPKNEKRDEDTDADPENYKTLDTDKTEVLQNKISNGNSMADIDNSDSLTGNESMGNISDKHPENTESLVNNTKEVVVDSQEVVPHENNDGVYISKEMDTLNGLESNHDSEDDLSKYVEDAEDPISSGEPKQDDLEKLDSKQSDETGEETGTFKIVTINRYHSEDDDSSDISDSDEEPKVEDTVSITSGGDDSRENVGIKNNEVIILENDNMDSLNGTKSPEIHEICSDNSDKDDCIVTAVKKAPKTPKNKKSFKTITPSTELRRSSRAIKRKRYDDDIEELDDESDLEEVTIEDPLQSKSRTIINNSKSNNSVTSKAKRKANQNKEDMVVIIGSSIVSKNNSTETIKSSLPRKIFQKITAQGTSVTPISVKNVEKRNMAIQVTPDPILPTLTDDMFVVEAPSFIVPYVYEKPAVVPFKEFVEKLGKEMEEQKAKAEQELLEKKKAEKAKREQERQEKRDRGEEVQESEEEDSDEVKKKKAEKAERKERRRRKKEDDDVSWDGSSEESDDESISEDDSQTKENIINDIKDVVVPKPKTDSYFDLSLGKFFIDIGSNLVQQYVQTDLLHQQNKKLQREKKTGHSTKNRQVSIALLTKNLEMSQKTNALFTFKQKKCKFCTFKTESEIALQHHLETPHMKNNMYICNYCLLELQSPHNMLFHMEKSHGVKGRLERAPVVHQCPNCPFEDLGRGKLGRHLIGCTKRFKPDTNLAPPVEWEHPAKIPKLTRARAPMTYQAAHFARQPTDGGSLTNVRIPIGNALTSPTFRPRLITGPVRPTGILIRQTTPPQPSTNVANAKKSNHAIVISPSPRAASPIQPLNASGAKGVVMCEICDGYIKDLEQLRNHMQWIHKVRIHPKMIYNRPPLNCQKCHFRFFTDQGLERHLLGSHGLITNAIQEAANKGKDAGRCPVCGRAYQRKLLAHVSRDHSLCLKPAHLSYKCTVCTATFGMYRQFENHVYSAHSVVAKKVMDKKVAGPAKAAANDNATKQLKANDNITNAIPQPVKIAATKEK